MSYVSMEQPGCDYLPPWSEDAEKSVLGSVLIDNRVMEGLRHLLRSDDFYRGAHGKVWGAMVALWNEREPIDIVTLPEHLTKRGIFDEIGGMGAVLGFCDATPTAANAEHHAKIVLRNSELRSMLQVFKSAQSDCYHRREPEEIASRVMGLLSERTRRLAGAPYRHIAEGVYEFLERVQKGPTQVGETIDTGIRDFDDAIGGLPKGLVTVSGRTGEGKTTVAEWFSLGIAKQGIPVLFVTMEVPEETLVERFISMLGRIKSQVIRCGPEEALEEEREHILDTACRLQSMPLWVMSHPEPSVAQIGAVARAIEQREGRTPVVFIDRLELLAAMHDDDVANTTRKVRAVKKLQMELDVTVVLLCQLNQDSKRRPDPKPRLSDLLGSGAIKNDSQMVIMLYRPAYDGENDPRAFLYVRKNNYGPTGKVSVMFHPEYPAFSAVMN